MAYVKFDVSVRTWVSRKADRDGEWSRDSTDGEVVIKSATLVPDFEFDAIPILDEVEIGDCVYLVWAQYQTGDSFGTDGGQYELICVTSSKGLAEKERDVLSVSQDIDLPWNGYFNKLQGIYVSCFKLRGEGLLSKLIPRKQVEKAKSRAWRIDVPDEEMIGRRVLVRHRSGREQYGILGILDTVPLGDSDISCIVGVDLDEEDVIPIGEFSGWLLV